MHNTPPKVPGTNPPTTGTGGQQAHRGDGKGPNGTTPGTKPPNAGNGGQHHPGHGGQGGPITGPVKQPPNGPDKLATLPPKVPPAPTQPNKDGYQFQRLPGGMVQVSRFGQPVMKANEGQAQNAFGFQPEQAEGGGGGGEAAENPFAQILGQVLGQVVEKVAEVITEKVTEGAQQAVNGGGQGQQQAEEEEEE